MGLCSQSKKKYIIKRERDGLKQSTVLLAGCPLFSETQIWQQVTLMTYSQSKRCYW